MAKRGLFTRIAGWTSHIVGTPAASIIAFSTIAAWAVTGPLFGFSDTWQLVINTGTTIITFLMVFLIQNTQNRDSKALHIKIDELIRATEGAHTALLDLEELSEKELREICLRYEKIASESRKILRKGDEDTHVPHIEFAHEGKPKKKSAKKAKHK